MQFCQPISRLGDERPDIARLRQFVQRLPRRIRLRLQPHFGNVSQRIGHVNAAGRLRAKAVAPQHALQLVQPPPPLVPEQFADHLVTHRAVILAGTAVQLIQQHTAPPRFIFQHPDTSHPLKARRAVPLKNRQMTRQQRPRQIRPHRHVQTAMQPVVQNGRGAGGFGRRQRNGRRRIVNPARYRLRIFIPGKRLQRQRRAAPGHAPRLPPVCHQRGNTISQRRRITGPVKQSRFPILNDLRRLADVGRYSRHAASQILEQLQRREVEVGQGEMRRDGHVQRRHVARRFLMGYRPGDGDSARQAALAQLLVKVIRHLAY